jgi:hypothetical protein
VVGVDEANKSLAYWRHRYKTLQWRALKYG